MCEKRILFWCVLLFSATLLSIPKTTEATDPLQFEASERPSLPDLPLFVEQRLAQWVGAGNGMSIEYEVDDYDAIFLPLDEDEILDELPSYRVAVTGENGWWSVTLAGNNWEPFSLAPYAANGELVFNIKSELPVAAQIGISDLNFDREQRGNVPQLVQIEPYVSADNAWQEVRIPLRELLADGDDFRLTQVSTVQISGTNGQPQLFWLNNIRFVSADPEPAYPVIKLNQVGYFPDQPKVAKVSGFAELLSISAETPYEIRSAADDSVAHSGMLELVTANDPVISGEQVLQADFSALTRAGDYYVAIEGIDHSPTFEIKSTLYEQLIVDSMRYFYLQRVGIDLDEATAGEFARQGGHTQDRVASFKSQTYAPMDVSGGWYDAGDYGKYTNAGATAVSDLLWAYELFDDQFSDRHLNIIESGNGVPDILDEARWELEWILKMQDVNTGGFYHAVQDTEDASPIDAIAGRTIEDVFVGKPKDPTDDRYHVIPTATTGSAVAALAHGALVYREIDSMFADELLKSAEYGWEYLVNHPETIESVDGPYSDNDDHDDRFWAAAALYRATGDSRYHDYVRFVYEDINTLFDSSSDNAYGVGTVGMLGWLAYMHSAELDPQLTDKFDQLFTQWSTMMLERHSASAWNLTLLDADFYWGSNYVMLTTPLVLAVGQAATGDIAPETKQIARDALDYLLGNNPLRFSFVSGYGEHRVEELFSIIWRNDGITAEPPGILAGGANEYTNPLLPSNFAGKQYVDSAGAWSMNEHTVYWNAALVFNAALVMDEGGNSAETPSRLSQVAAAATPLRVVLAASGSMLTIVIGWRVLKELLAD